MADLIDREQALDALRNKVDYITDRNYANGETLLFESSAIEQIEMLPSAQPDIAENLYLYKCYITDKDGLQHEVIHTGDIRRVTGWMI